MLVDTYFKAIASLLESVASDETPRIEAAAQECASSIAAGGVVHIHDSGHMLNSELVHRAGGLVGFTPFTFALNVSNPNAFRDKSGGKPDLTSETVALALKAGNIKAGDVLFVGSVSGKSAKIVELAVQAKAAGVKVIAVTSIAYSSELKSEHPSGKRLFEVVDLAIDNHAPYGDAMIEAPGLPVKACPASGIAAACIMWAIIAGIIERLLQMGIEPSVYRSANAPGGLDDGNRQRERYKEYGY